jgi:hypothetical protein
MVVIFMLGEMRRDGSGWVGHVVGRV